MHSRAGGVHEQAAGKHMAYKLDKSLRFIRAEQEPQGLDSKEAASSRLRNHQQLSVSRGLDAVAP